MRPRATFKATRAVLVAGAFVCAAASASAQAGDSVPSPFTLLRRSPTEPSWAATLRLRDAESRFRGDPQWRSAYCQLRAQSEIWLGDHAAALREIGRCWGAWSDTTYSIPAGTRATDAVAFIAAAGDTARVVMVNERHHAVSDRLLTLELLPVLWRKGYRYFAAEAFDWRDTSINHRPYPVSGVSGGYVDEPVFGEVVREARRLGYTLVPYEMEPAQNAVTDSVSPQQRRDRAQARNLNDRIFRVDAPEREHAGYRAAVAAGLVAEKPVVLIDSAGRPVSPVAFGVDFQVLTPRTSYLRGRPSWMALGTRRRAVDIAVPECAGRHCVVEARLVGDGDDAVPLDRTEARGDTVTLFLPPAQRTRVRVLSPRADVLRTFEAVPR